MHSIKSKARHASWRSDDTTPWGKYNPFMRKAARKRQEDEERDPSVSSLGAGPITDEPKEITPMDTSYNGGPRQRKGDKPEEEQAELSVEDEEKADKKKRKSKLFESNIPPWQQVKAVLFPHWYTINWLLIAAPVGIAINYVKVDPLAVFLVNFIAIIPLAGILSFATEEIALRVGEVIGGLLNASFGNAVELIVGIIALAHGEIIIVQTSLVGSMLSNLLLVLGMCFFFGGINRVEQFFNTTVAQTAASLLALSVGALIIPTAFTWGPTGINAAETKVDEQVSYGTAIIMLLIYAAYLIFQLKSHKTMYNAPSQKVEKRKGAKKGDGDVKKAFAGMGGVIGATSGGQNQQAGHLVTEDEEEEPVLSFWGAIITLVAATALIGLCAEYLVDSISAVTCKGHVSDYFVGLILLPIVGNAAEHATAVTVAIKDKMDLSIGVAVGSSMQIALLVLPLMVIIGWIIKEDMTLVFDDFQIAVLFVAVILVNYLIGDGKSHWLEGVLLMSLYIIIALAAWFYPTQNKVKCEVK